MSDAKVENLKAAAKSPEKKQEASKASKPAEAAPQTAAAAEQVSPVVPEPVREAVEASVTQAKENYEQAKAVAEETTDALEESVAAAMRGANDFNEQLLAALKDEAFARYDLLRDLSRAGTPLEAFEIQGKYLRARLDAAQARSAAFAKLASRVTAEASEPARESMLKTVRALTPAT